VDPVALDMACAAACNNARILRGSCAEERIVENEVQDLSDLDVFTLVHPDTNWKVCVDHAVKLGLGNKEYEITEV
jgi:uncharacterized Fe-S center protein